MKRQYNARLEPEAIAALKSQSEALGVSIADVIEATAYWLAGDDRGLADCPLAVREAIAARAGAIHPATAPTVQPAPTDVEVMARLADVLGRIDALEAEVKNGEGAIAA